MRNLKTALAIFICLLLYQFLPGDPAFACIAAVIAMQPTIEDSLLAGVNRIIGTVIGGIFGALFVLLDRRYHSSDLLHLLLVAAVVTLLIMLCNVIGKNGATVMGCVTYLVIVLSTAVGNPWLYALGRTLNNTVGIAVAVGINLTIIRPART